LLAVLIASVANIRCKKTDIDQPDYSLVPLIFHIVHNGEQVGAGSNISEAEVSRQLDKINEQFKDLQVQFRLALTNPEGKKLVEPGVNRVLREKSEYTFGQAWVYAYQIFWDPKEYLNALIIDVDNEIGDEIIIGQGRSPFTISENPLPGLGISYFPDNPIGYADGIIIDTYYFAHHHVAVHELGHFFGLRHTFKSECDTSDADYCEDTPTYSRDAYEEDNNVWAKRLSCDSVPFISDNYMDYYYSYNSTFTADQRKRVQHVLKYSPRRRELVGSNQLPTEVRDNSNKAGGIDSIPEIVN